MEVTGTDPRTAQATPENPWRRTLLWVPIYVGVPEPAAPDDVLRAPSANPADATTWAARILDAYDEARAKAGKPRIARDGRLTALAQERSGVVARAGREPPPDAVLADKLAAAGFPPHDFDEVETRVDAVADYVHQRLLEPSVRRRLLGANALAVGLGLAPNAPNAKGEVDYTLVEDDVEPVSAFDAAKDRAAVRAALDAQQKAEGRAPFLHDEDVGDKYHQWGTPVWRAGYDFARWADTSLLARSKEAPLPYAEVGLCQGELPGKPGGSYVVVIQYGP